MIAKLRNRQLVLGAAFLFIFLGAVDTTYAQTPLEQVITLDDVQSISAAALTISGNPGIELPTDSTVLDLSGISAVDPHSIALVSIVARQIETAKKPDGARAVATALINENYPEWNKSQISCLNQLWTGESHWNYQAHNYRSGAQGIAQALPPTKMEIVSTDWRTNPVTQIRWGLQYIKARYGTPCQALRKKHRSHYY